MPRRGKKGKNAAKKAGAKGKPTKASGASTSGGGGEHAEVAQEAAGGAQPQPQGDGYPPLRLFEPLHVPRSDAPEVEQLRALLGYTVRISLVDGRKLEGVFACVDKERNFILRDALEWRTLNLTSASGESMVVEEKRLTGMVAVPGQHMVDVEMDERCLSAINRVQNK